MAARRPGLVAKKLMVKGKKGTTKRTYWVRPEDNAGEKSGLARLAEARKKDKKKEEPEDDWLSGPSEPAPKKAKKLPEPDDGDDWLSGPVAPKAYDREVHKRELLSFFANRGLHKLPKSVDIEKLMDEFRKPDGSPMDVAALDKVFKHPGQVRLPVLRVKIPKEYETWGVLKTEPVLGKDGTPKYEDMHTRIEFIDIENAQTSGGGFTFVMEVKGQRLGKDGKPDGSAPVTLSEDLVRTFNRQLPEEWDERGAEGIHVHHELFVLKPEYSGGGLGMKILKNQMANYPELGVSDVTVNSMQMGSYVWGRMGFEATDDYKRREDIKFLIQMRNLQKGRDALLKAPDTPYTADELAEMHSLEEHGTPAVFGLSVPHYNPQTNKVELIPLWKKFMLRQPPMDTDPRGGGLAGHLAIKPGDANYEQMRRYLKLSKGGES